MRPNDRGGKPSQRCVPATSLSLTAWTLTGSEHPIKEKKNGGGGASGCHRVEEEEEQEQEEERQQHGQQEGAH